jgi:exosome complex component RRP41
MEGIVKETFESVVLLDLYPRSEIDVVIHVLEADGSVICCIINAVSMALMDAGIAMEDMIVSCSAGKRVRKLVSRLNEKLILFHLVAPSRGNLGLVRHQICVDLTQIEQVAGGAYLPMAVTAR